MNLFQTWRQDARSSLVVFLVALPLCLGIALASNAPLAAGLFAGIIGGIVVGTFSGSNISVSGPAAGLTVIVVNAIAELGAFEAFSVAVFFSGLIQIFFGFIRGGVIGNYFPNSVIKGMLAAIGLILILKQFPHAIGYDIDFMGDLKFMQKDGNNTFTEIFVAFDWLNWGAVIISSLSVLIMLIWERMSAKEHSFFKMFPGALMAVVAGVALNEIFHATSSPFALNSEHLVTLPFTGGFGDLLANAKFPDWSHLTNPMIFKVAFTLALVGSLESLLSIDAADKLSGPIKPTNKNRELFAQGIANTLSGIVGALPITAVIVRTSANVNAGAKSKLSTILHGTWLLLCVALIPNLLNKIPLSALAAILILVGYKLTKPALIKSMYKKGWNQFIPFILTILSILFTDLLTGIGIGLIVGLFFILRNNMHRSIVVVKDEGSFLIRFHKDTSFLHKAFLIKTLNRIPNNSEVIIDGEKVFLDEDIIELLEDFIQMSSKRNITVQLEKSNLSVNRLFKDT